MSKKSIRRIFRDFIVQTIFSSSYLTKRETDDASSVSGGCCKESLIGPLKNPGKPRSLSTSSKCCPRTLEYQDVQRLCSAEHSVKAKSKGTKRLPPLALTSPTPPFLLHGNMVSLSHALCGRCCQAAQLTRILLRKILLPLFFASPPP